MEQDVDIVTARAIALLPPSSRRRLDEILRWRRTWPRDRVRPFHAHSGEIEGISLSITSRRGRLATSVRLSSHATWERHALRVAAPIPDAIVAALRRRQLDSVVAHPLLGGLRITSARREGDVVVIETARLPLVDVATVASTGVDRPLDLIETLRALGVEQVCRVAADLVQTVPTGSRHLLAARLAAARRSDLVDIAGWKPTGALSQAVHVTEGRLEANVLFTVGRFTNGSLSLNGASRTNGRILSGPFARFRLWPSNGHRPRLQRPHITLDELAEQLQPRAARAA